MAINVNFLATVSKPFGDRKTIRDIPNSANREQVAVDFYAYQTTNKNDDIGAFQCQAMFFGRRAETIKEYLKPGMSVHLKGELVQTTREHEGNTYVNNQINNANFEFLPGSYGSSDASNASDDGETPGTSSPPPTRNTRSKGLPGAGVTFPQPTSSG